MLSVWWSRKPDLPRRKPRRGWYTAKMHTEAGDVPEDDTPQDT